MDEIKQKVVDAVAAAGGSVEWVALLDNFDYREQRQLMDAVRILESENQVKRTITRQENAKPLFTVDAVVGGGGD